MKVNAMNALVVATALSRRKHACEHARRLYADRAASLQRGRGYNAAALVQLQSNRLFIAGACGTSSARQKYHAATDRYGRHFSPIFANCFGFGSFRFPNVFANPFSTP